MAPASAGLKEPDRDSGKQSLAGNPPLSRRSPRSGAERFRALRDGAQCLQHLVEKGSPQAGSAIFQKRRSGFNVGDRIVREGRIYDAWGFR
jgi:hypothetical protein